MSNRHTMSLTAEHRGCVAVIWIDWYPYHVARFRGLQSSYSNPGQAVGIELVGGIGVHAGLKFREPIPAELPVFTLLPDSDWNSASRWQLGLRLWKMLDTLQPATVLVPGYSTAAALLAALWAKFHGRRAVLMTESTAYDHARIAWKEKLKALLIRNLFGWAMTGGVAHRRYLLQLGFPADRIVGGYDVVDNDYFESEAKKLRAAAEPRTDRAAQYFLYIGRLSAEKNVHGLLNAWNTYRAAGGTWKLVLVGSGAAEKELRESARRHPFGEDVVFAGHRGSSDLPGYYAHAGCFVLPSTREPWGLVVNEALASSLPVIVSSRCGSAEDLVKPGVNGYVFDPHDTEELAGLLTRMEAKTEEERARMGDHSLQIIQRFSPTFFGEEIRSIHLGAPTYESGTCDLAEES